MLEQNEKIENCSLVLLECFVVYIDVLAASMRFSVCSVYPNILKNMCLQFCSNMLNTLEFSGK